MKLLVILIILPFLTVFLLNLFTNYFENEYSKEYKLKKKRIEEIVDSNDSKAKYEAFNLLKEIGDILHHLGSKELECINNLKWKVANL